MEKYGKDYVNNYAKTLGIIFIILGILHWVVPQLEASWGIILVTLGIVSLSYRVKAMILVAGIALITVGVLNILTSLFVYSYGFWLFLGFLQIYWGIQETRKYPKVKENPKYNIKETKKGFIWNSLRIAFWILIGVMIFGDLLVLFIGVSDIALMGLFLLSFALMVFVSIVSIIHLAIHKNKGLAVIALVISSLLMFIYIVFFIYGLFLGSVSDSDMNALDNSCLELCLEVEDAEYYQLELTEDETWYDCVCTDAQNNTIFNEEMPFLDY